MENLIPEMEPNIETVKKPQDYKMYIIIGLGVIILILIIYIYFSRDSTPEPASGAAVSTPTNPTPPPDKVENYIDNQRLLNQKVQNENAQLKKDAEELKSDFVKKEEPEVQPENKVVEN